MSDREATWFVLAAQAGPSLTLAEDPAVARREEDLIEREDWHALGELRRKQFESCPCACCGAAVAEVLFEQERVAEALALLTPLERFEPGDPLIGELIVNALARLGRDFDDFPWTQAPRVFRLGREVLDRCFEHLRGSGETVAVATVRASLFGDAYLDFDSSELAGAMAADGRFVVTGLEGARPLAGARRHEPPGVPRPRSRARELG